MGLDLNKVIELEDYKGFQLTLHEYSYTDGFAYVFKRESASHVKILNKGVVLTTRANEKEAKQFIDELQNTFYEMFLEENKDHVLAKGYTIKSNHYQRCFDVYKGDKLEYGCINWAEVLHCIDYDEIYGQGSTENESKVK